MKYGEVLAFPKYHENFQRGTASIAIGTNVWPVIAPADVSFPTVESWINIACPIRTRRKWILDKPLQFLAMHRMQALHDVYGSKYIGALPSGGFQLRQPLAPELMIEVLALNTMAYQPFAGAVPSSVDVARVECSSVRLASWTLGFLVCAGEVMI